MRAVPLHWVHGFMAGEASSSSWLHSQGHSVRDPNDPEKVQHLLQLDGAKDRLHLFKANLLEEGSFDSVVEECEVVVDETWFSHPDIFRELEVWYVLSKTLAEDATWKFAKENNIDMVALNPALVVGPLLQPTLNTCAAAVLDLINGDFSGQKLASTHRSKFSRSKFSVFLIRHVKEGIESMLDRD
ncbi:hypothetical protein L6164_026023 [Bauhinia variegata]|uniref:Uncharacterized protein n=1 Tax=Bauhinia variegata TaxID=167791 RepID=A0ACB9M4I4_BAUVA|nr:hypothetical protein L6164_026023 [Bauhinia variegata]